MLIKWKNVETWRICVLVFILFATLISSIVLSSDALTLAFQIRFGSHTQRAEVLNRTVETLEQKSGSPGNKVPWWAVSPALHDKDPLIRITTARIQYFLRPTDPEGLETLFSLLQDPNPEVRSIAQGALYSFDRYADRVIKALKRSLYEDTDQMVRSDAALILLGMSKKHSETRTILDMAALNHPSKETRAKIIKRLAEWDARHAATTNNPRTKRSPDR